MDGNVNILFLVKTILHAGVLFPFLPEYMARRSHKHTTTILADAGRQWYIVFLFFLMFSSIPF